jgi:acetyltransferase-like isoleucine patch superfamily enzyme
MSARTLVFVLLFVLPPQAKPWLLRVLLGAQVGRGVSIGWFASVMGRHVALGDYSAVRPFTLIRCTGDVVIGRYALISSFTLVYGAAGLSVGEHSYIGPQCLINTEEDVRLGRWSALGARCMVYTHGSWFPYTEGYWVRFGPVTIGDYVWCAAGVFLHPGVEIGEHSFINSAAVVRGVLPAGAVAEGNPAQQVGEIDRMRRTMSSRRLDAAVGQMLRHFAALTLQQAEGLRVQEQADGVLSFRRGRTDYRIVPVGIQGPDALASDGPARHIWVISRPHWRPSGSPLWLDLHAGTMTQARDPVYVELALFLKRYYGIQLEYQDGAQPR